MNEFMTEWDKLMETLHLPEHKFTVEEVEEIIKDYDFVPVVRCKDCKYRIQNPHGYTCKRLIKEIDLDDYCSWGQRRDEDETD